jgi:hypothetical protein
VSDRVSVYWGDSRVVLADLPDASVDAVVSDPPYALVSIVRRFGGENAAPAAGDVYRRASAGFMGKTWDTGETAFDPAFWAEVLRVAKPGAHMILSAGTRSYHRLACAVEDAGWEIRDMLAWLYGSGFPKSHDMAKAIDRERGLCGLTADAYMPASAEARDWQGWGTALKPALEPLLLARKPVEGTIARNLQVSGVGALNVDACRIAAEPWDSSGDGLGGSSVRAYGDGLNNSGRSGSHQLGRWPANVLHDGSEDVLQAFPDAPGQQGAVTGAEPTANGFSGAVKFSGMRARISSSEPRSDSGSAARFFYSAKADTDDRLGSEHPTVKPVDLMAWMVRLITPGGGARARPLCRLRRHRHGLPARGLPRHPDRARARVCGRHQAPHCARERRGRAAVRWAEG